MSLPTQTTAAINATIISQFEGSLGQTIPFLPKSALRVIARVCAGVFILLYKYVGWIFLQMFVATASADETTINGKKIRPLVQWGRLIGEGDPIAAQQAELILAVTVLTQDPAKNIAAGEQAIRSETGVIYTVLSSTPLNAPVIQVRVRAVSDQSGGDGSGDVGNLQPGDLVSFANPVPNIKSEASVVSQAVTGADAEAIETYRSRVVKRFRRKPQGGAYADYDAWARTVAGIINVYPYASNTPGVVDIYVEASADSSGSADGFPTTAQKDDVFTAIQGNDTGLATRRPVGAAITVLPIFREAIELEVEGLLPDTPEAREKVRAAVDEYLRSREPFIEGFSVLPRADRITQAAVGGIVETVVEAEGASVVQVVIVPGPAHTLAHGQKAKLGVSTFVS